MKKNKLTIIIVAVLVIITAIIAAVHLSSRVSPPKGVLRIEAAGKVTELPLSQLELTNVHGTVVNGKGEERTVDAQGLLLSDVLAQAGVSTYAEVTVVADDEYTAVVTADEVEASDRVFLLIEAGEQPQLLVFGDTNSKRNVSNVIRLVVT